MKKTHICSRCNKRKLGKYFSRKGKNGYSYWCKECKRTNSRDKTCRLCLKSFRPKKGWKRRHCEICYPINRRAQNLFAAAQHRAKTNELSFNIDIPFIEKLLLKPCPVTGVLWDFSPYRKGNRNTYRTRKPYTPSLDKINPEKGYTKANTRVVAWIYNLCKSRYSDKEVKEFCQKVADL